MWNKRPGNRYGHAVPPAAAQPKLHENMDEVFLHGESDMVDNSPKIKSAKFVPLSLVMNNNKKVADPPDDSDSSDEGIDAENYRRPREDFSDVETNNMKHAHRNDGHIYIIGQRNNTQFHIQPEQLSQQKQQQQLQHHRREQKYHHISEESDESDSDHHSNSDDEENATFFPSSTNFNFATDNSAPLQKEGKNFGVDYLKIRAARKAKERQHRFEIESWRQQRQSKCRCCCWEDDPDEFDDVDFLDYEESRKEWRKRRIIVANMAVFLASFIVGMVIMEHQMHFLFGKSSSSSKHSTVTSLHDHGANASSRWGHRFDDDEFEGDDIVFDTVVNTPKYHSQNHHKHGELTPGQEKEELARWEDYEMDVANVLANSGKDWDIYSKTGGVASDGLDNREKEKVDHWVQYFDQSSQHYYYFHKETNTSTWTKPEIVKGVVLLGLTRTGTEYVVEEFKGDENVALEVAGDSLGNEVVQEVEGEKSDAMSTSIEEAPSNFQPQVVLDQFKDTFWRWNHPYRIPERTEVWGGIDTPVFWHIPHSGATTVEEIFEHCYHMVIAGTTGSNNDGKIVLKRNITDHLSVYTLEDGAHYLNINLRTPEGIKLARTAGLGQSGVADVILTRYIFNAADLFRDTGHTGRCFAFIRHPIERIESKFHTLKRNNASEVKEMTLDEYAKSEIAESNWMIRMIINATEDEVLTPSHYQVAKEIFGRKCLVGLMNHFEESMDRFSKFFRFESTHSINTHNKGETSNFLEERRQCAHKLATSGVNRHQYTKMSHDSPTFKELERKNKYDMELYDYAKALYYQQAVVYEDLQ